MYCITANEYTVYAPLSPFLVGTKTCNVKTAAPKLHVHVQVVIFVIALHECNGIIDSFITLQNGMMNSWQIEF